MYLYIICSYFSKNKRLSLIVSVIFLIINISYLVKLDGLYDHSNFMNSSQSNSIHTFFSKNTWIGFVVMILFNNYFLKK